MTNLRQRPLPVPLAPALALAVVWSAPFLPPARAQAPADALATIQGLRCVKQAGSVRVSFRIEGALGPDIRASLESGIAVTFVHKVSLYRRRALFFDRSLGHKTIEVSAALDTLTGQYTLTRKTDNVPDGASTTDRPEEMERWMSEVRDELVPLPADAGKGSIELRVKTEYEKDYFVLWLLPWSLSAIDDKECR